MNATRTAFLLISMSGLLPAGEIGTGPAPLSVSKDAKDSVFVPPPAPPRPWSLGAGITFRRIGAIDFRTGLTPDTLPRFFGEDSFTAPPGIGPLDAFADRTYGNGFVNLGAATAGTGLTTNWGYDNSAQVQGDNLVFTRSGGERRDVAIQNTANVSGWSDGAQWNAGPVIELSYAVPVGSSLTGGFAVNFSSVNIDGSQQGLNTISQFQQLDTYNVTAVDTYALNDIVAPAAPYAGSFTGPGPLIGNAPDDRAFPESLASTETVRFSDRVRDELQLDLHTLGVGGHLTWSPHPRVSLTGQAGVAVNLADWRAKRSGAIVQSTNGGPAATFSTRSERADDLDLLFGIYLQGNVAWSLSEAWALQTFLRYDWNEDLDGTVGPSSFNVDLSGWSVGAGARFSF